MPPYTQRPQQPQALLPAVLSEPRIVLAIDYGTTFTGLAWMQTDGENVPQFSDLKLFVDWPGKNEAKVPSEVSYSLTSGDAHYQQWGNSIDSKSKVLRWTKLELVKESSPLEELEILRQLVDGLVEVNKLHDEDLVISDVPRHLSKTTENVIEFYLNHVAREWVTFVKRQARHVLDIVPVDIVVTYPAMWPDTARNTLLRAVCGAFSNNTLLTRRNIHVMSEPEACALYVIQDVIRTNAGPLQTGTCFILCDAGGGTIDLVSYYLDSITPLRLIRVGKVTGAPVGATTVDRAFLSWLDTKVRNLDIRPLEYGKGGHYVLMPRGNMLLNRFEKFKRSFSGTESYDLPIPRDAVITSDEQDQESHQLHISTETMKEMFKESIEGVKRLITQQVIQVEEESQDGIKCKVSHVFLAGGFAESEYLFSEVKKTARRFGYIQVQRAADCWSSVVKGAVLRGMAIGAKMPPKIATCPRRYGLSLNGGVQRELREGVWEVDPLDEKAFSSNQIIWLVERGDVIFTDSVLKKTIKLCFRTLEPGQASNITLVANASDNVPTGLEELKKVRCLVEDVVVRMDRLQPTDFTKTKISNARGRRRFQYSLSVQVELTVKNAVTIDIKYGNQVIGTRSTTSL